MFVINIKIKVMRKIIFYLSAIALVLTSCKKNTEFNNFDTLTKDSWMVEDIKNEEGNSVIEDCQKDDIIQFEDKSFSHIEGANDCSEGMFLRSAEWSFAEDGGMIKITKAIQTTSGIGGGALTEKYYIITLNENELVLKKKDENDVYYFER
jgi:hypothetical protein